MSQWDFFAFPAGSFYMVLDISEHSALITLYLFGSREYIYSADFTSAKPLGRDILQVALINKHWLAETEKPFAQAWFHSIGAWESEV